MDLKIMLKTVPAMLQKRKSIVLPILLKQNFLQ